MPTKPRCHPRRRCSTGERRCRCLLTLPFATSAFAQSYPDRPIRMIVPFAPGGITDVSARLIAQLMSVSVKQTIVIENRSGGGGTIGATAVARAEPDGYTLLVSSSATNAILPAMHERLDYDPIKSFLPIARISSAPYLLIVNADVPVKKRARACRLRQSQSEIRVRGADRNAAAYPRLRVQGADRRRTSPSPCTRAAGRR